MKKFYALPLVFLLFLTANALAQGNPVHPDANGIIYVNSAAAPGGDGSSWANAIPELADALKWARQQYDANSNFSISVYIAKGTYKPLYNAADRSYTTDGGRNNAFVMLKHLQLYGGFPNTGNPGFDDRDWNANPTILSGDIGTIGDNSDNTYHVVISSGPAGSARLNGLTISGGNANNAGATVRVGGLYLVGSFGGGVFNLHSSPFIENTKILNNSAQLGGGGMFNSTSSPTIRNATISNNNSRIIGGGGMFNREASPAIINTIFSNNHTNGAGGGMYNFTSSSPIILNTLISYNSAQQDGGGMYNNISSSPTIVNTTISNNSAGNLGGGMTNYKASPIVENSIIFGNRLTDGSVANISNGDPAFSPVFKYSLIGGATSWNPGWGTDGGNNIITTTNPFADAANGDFSLMPGTAAINGGSNTLYSDVGGGDKDLAGNNRVYDLAGGGIIDIGAYEYQGIPVHPDANGIIYVNSAAAPGGDGSSWANAIPELADALKWARQQHNADNNWLQNSSLRIYIAKGTYKPLYNAADGLYTTDGGRDNAFVMVENVQLYGGFPNTGNPGFDDRDWKANPTILSGDIGTANNNSDNTYHVVISAGDVGSASLNGVTISGGNADGTTFIDVNELGFSSVSGGGMHNNSSSITILNTTISNNSAQRGGGMFNRYSSPTILNTTISNNSAQDAGGMHNQDSSPTILNTIISNNSAQNNGGGMHNSFSSPTITNTIISNNHSGDSGGGMINGVSSPTILNTTISNNSAQTVGGGMYNSSSSSPVVNNSIVFGNRLTDGSISNIFKDGPSTTPVFKYSLIGGATSWNAAWGTDGGNNIVTTSNPFVDIANGDFSLKPGAAAMNGGSNTLYTDAGGDLDNDTDLAGNARVYDLAGGGIVDMGAYEYQGVCHDILIAEQPLQRTVCLGAETSFSLEATGGDLTYQWQFSSDGGTSFSDLEENTVYSGVATATLTIAAAASETAGLYRCVISNECYSLESEAAALGVTLVEITGTPPAGRVDVAYNFTFSVSGGSEPYTWSVSQGELPDWLELNTETGAISGIPESAGDVTFTLQAEDASGCAATLAVNLTIAPGQAPVITFPEMEAVVYGVADFAPGASANSDNEVEYVSSDPDVAMITTSGLIQIVGAGTTDITASLPEDPNYENAMPVTRELVVNPATLTVTANDDSKTYDGAPYNGGNGVTVTGWQYDDTDALLGGTLSYSGSSQGAADAGVYEIIPSGYEPLEDYLFEYRAGTLTIAPAARATITFPELEAIVYGAPSFDPGAASSDGREVVYASSDETVARITAEGLIQIIGAGTAGITASLPANPNYQNTEPVTRELAVNPATLTVTANDDSKTYDGSAYSGGSGVQFTGFVYGQDQAVLGGALTWSGTAQGAADAGSYAILPGGYTSENYAIDYQSGTLLIEKAPLTITADNKTRKYNQADPAFTFTYTGFVNGEDESELDELPSATTTATETSAPGTYPITPAGAASGNYGISYSAGTLTVLPGTRGLAFAPLPEKTYGDPDFAPGAVVTGSSEEVIYTSSNPGVAGIVDGKIRISGAGTAEITATLPENPNYEPPPVATRKLVVRKAPQTIDFALIGEISRNAGIISLEVAASSGLPVTLSSSDLQVAGVAGETQLEIRRLGTSLITATQGGNENYLPAQPVSRELKVFDPQGKLVKVHPVVSPNSDGINEFLLVEGIRDYPENKMTIVNRNGVKVFEIAGYDNGSRVFKGLANTVTNYDFLPQGTYFYLVEIKTPGGWKRETGWFVMKFSAN